MMVSLLNSNGLHSHQLQLSTSKVFNKVVGECMWDTCRMLDTSAWRRLNSLVEYLISSHCMLILISACLQCWDIYIITPVFCVENWYVSFDIPTSTSREKSLTTEQAAVNQNVDTHLYVFTTTLESTIKCSLNVYTLLNGEGWKTKCSWL